MRPRTAHLLVVSAAALLCACSTLRQKPAAPAPASAPAAVAAAPQPAPAPAPPAAAVRRAPVSCVPKSLPAPPRYPDTDASLRAAGEPAQRYQLLAAGRLIRMRRLAELERVVEACRRAGG